MPNLPLAQTGLTDVTGGILILAIVALLALLGIILGAVAVIYRKWILLVAGLAAATPALALVGYIVWLERPQIYEWDFSADRNVARLDEEPVYGRYYYQGNLRTTIRLPGGRGWTGKAGLVTFRAESGQVDSLFWDSRALSTDEAFSEARRVLGELRLAETAPLASSESVVTGNLDFWYEATRSEDWKNFNVETPPASADKPGSNPRVNLYLRRRPGPDESEAPTWTLHVEVVWEE